MTVPEVELELRIRLQEAIAARSQSGLIDVGVLSGLYGVGTNDFQAWAMEALDKADHDTQMWWRGC